MRKRHRGGGVVSFEVGLTDAQHRAILDAASTVGHGYAVLAHPVLLGKTMHVRVYRADVAVLVQKRIGEMVKEIERRHGP